MKKLTVASLAVAAFAFTLPASAAGICKTQDKSQWMSKQEISKKVAELGYEVRYVKEEDGCWEVKGKKDGKRVEAYFDPVSAELVLTK